MRADAIFIAVEVDDAAAADVDLAAKLTDACPVDIFAQADDGSLVIVEDNLDECVLCRLCIDAAAGWEDERDGGRGGRDLVSIVKLYDAGALLA
jgi:ferredoxin-like protein FixX